MTGLIRVNSAEERAVNGKRGLWRKGLGKKVVGREGLREERRRTRI
jgi:hypothetical protein